MRIVGLSLRASTTISRIDLQLTHDRLGYHRKHLDQRCAAMHSLFGAWTDLPDHSHAIKSYILVSACSTPFLLFPLCYLTSRDTSYPPISGSPGNRS